MIQFEREELLPLVANLANRYCGYDSSSITYDMGVQLMGAVIYCMNQVTRVDKNDLISIETITPEQIYQQGYQLLLQKVKKAKDIYHSILPDFSDYNNRAYYETIILGMPPFFQYYDPLFFPQNTILTLDYPILIDLTGEEGINRILKYLECIQQEQFFLSHFSKNQIREILEKHHVDADQLFINIPSVVVREVLIHMPPHIEVKTKSVSEILQELEKRLDYLIQAGFSDSDKLYKYLQKDMKDLAVHLSVCKE